MNCHLLLHTHYYVRRLLDSKAGYITKIPGVENRSFWRRTRNAKRNNKLSVETNNYDYEKEIKRVGVSRINEKTKFRI